MEKVSQIAVVTAIFAGAVPAMASASPLPPTSFLHFPVDTVPGLAQEVASDPAVQERFARHFHLSGPALCSYVRDTLVLRTLESASPFRVSYVDSQAREYQATRTLPAGTPVFAARDTGQPILMAATGNPLTDVLSPSHSGGGVGGGAAAAAGLGALGLFVHSGGSGSSASGSQASSAPAPAVAAPVAVVRETSGAIPGLVVFTRSSVPPTPTMSEAGQPSVLHPAAEDQALFSQVLPNVVPSASQDVAGSPDTVRDETPTNPLIFGSVPSQPLAGPSALPAVPEPAPILTFTLPILLLAGLRLRRRIV